MAQPEIQRYSIHWTDSAFKYKRGKWVMWKDVAPYIVESRPTVRAKRPVQHAEVDICPKCKGEGWTRNRRNGNYSDSCTKCGGSGKRSTVG